MKSSLKSFEAGIHADRSGAESIERSPQGKHFSDFVWQHACHHKIKC
jgi:hypothetical protein